MYDSYIGNEAYNELKDKIERWINGDEPYVDIEELVDSVDKDYQDGEISSTQYDHLMNILSDYT